MVLIHLYVKLRQSCVKAFRRIELVAAYTTTAIDVISCFSDKTALEFLRLIYAPRPFNLGIGSNQSVGNQR